MGYSRERDGAWGKYTEHYDDSGNKIGESRERDGAWGKYVEHTDKSGHVTGESRDRDRGFGRYTEHRDATGTVVGESRQKDDAFGKRTEHYDDSGNKIGESRERDGAWGKYVEHTANAHRTHNGDASVSADRDQRAQPHRDSSTQGSYSGEALSSSTGGSYSYSTSVGSKTSGVGSFLLLVLALIIAAVVVAIAIHEQAPPARALLQQTPQVVGPLLVSNGTVTIPALPSFVAGEKLAVDGNDSAENVSRDWRIAIKIGHMDDLFKAKFLDLVVGPVGETQLSIHEIGSIVIWDGTRLVLARDGPFAYPLARIWKELGSEEGEVTLSQMFALLSQIETYGQAGEVFANGLANVFYMRDAERWLWVVSAAWPHVNNGWHIHVESYKTVEATSLVHFNASRVFSRTPRR